MPKSKQCNTWSARLRNLTCQIVEMFIHILQVIIPCTACPALRGLTIANYSLSCKLHFSLQLYYHYQLLNQATHLLAEVMTCQSISLVT